MSDEEKEKRLHAAGGGADTYERCIIASHCSLHWTQEM
jgi:hypothetical protein